jgi:hypothetical protein
MAVAGFFIATLVAPAVLTFVLRRTLAWWVAGVAIAGFGAYLLLTLDHGDHNVTHDMSAIDIGAMLQVGYGVFLLVYAALLLLAARARRKASRQPPPIPPARVV